MKDDKTLQKEILDFPNYPKVICPMSSVNRWYLDNKEYAESEPFYFPLEKGKIIFDDEEEVAFNFYTVTDDDGESLTIIFVEMLGRPIIGWDFVNPIERRGWCPRKEDIHYLLDHNDYVAQKLIDKVMKVDFIKNENKRIWRVMQYANLYREQIESSQTTVEKTEKVWNGKKYKNRVVTLHSKIYTLPQLGAIPKHRKWTRPTEEVSVRGFWRHYKSGKKVWVKPFSKYTDNEVKSAPTYIL